MARPGVMPRRPRGPSTEQPSRRASAGARALLIGMTLAPAFGCVPDLQSAMPSCPPPETVPYDSAPSGLVSPAVAEAVGRFEALNGDVAVAFVCPAENGGTITGRLTFSPAPKTELVVLSSGSESCGRGDVFWTGNVTLHAAALGGLDGQSAAIEGSDPSSFVVTFNPSYDRQLAAVGLIVFLDGSEPLGKLEIAFQPTAGPGGTTQQTGYECGVLRSAAASP
jgi:hypothetical protein